MNQFKETYNENYKRMFCMAQKMLNDKDAVNDILQDVFVYFYQKSESGHQINNPKSWLMRATINKCIDYSKHKKKYLKIDGVETFNLSDNEQKVDENVKVLKRALSKLNTKERTLAVLYSEGLSYKEISEISGVRFTSVGKMLSRTLMRLKEILKELEHEMF